MTPEDREILLLATELPPERRRAFLEQRLGEHDDRLRAVLALLSAYEGVGTTFLDADAPGEDDATVHVEGYEIRGILGEGSFGTVYLAQEQGQINREVALKVLRVVDTRAYERFHAERQYLAILEHPSIARIFAAGQAEDGRPYFAMERIHGKPITSHADAHQWSVERRIVAFMEVCKGVAYAHRSGVLHADLKPSNILVDTSDDRPRIIDFGVARTLSDRGPEAVAQRSLAGTPFYMSPELARGHAVDTRSDVYSLGVLLYQMLTGRVPAQKISSLPRHAFFQALGTTPAEPASESFASGSAKDRDELAAKRGTTARRLRRRLAGDLDAILDKALRLDPNERYSTVDALQEDIERSIARLPIAARGRRVDYIIRQAVLRHRLKLASLCLVLIVAVAGWTVWKQVARSDERAALSAQAAADWSRSAHGITDFFVSVLNKVGSEQSLEEASSTLGLLRVASKELDDKFRESPLVKAQLRHLIASAYMRVDAPAEAQREFEALGEIYRGIPGEESRSEAWRADLDAVGMMILAGRLEQAQTELVRLRTAMESIELGTTEFDQLELETNEAIAALSLGQLDRAIASATEAVKIGQRTKQGPESLASVYDVRTILAVALARRGDAEEARVVIDTLKRSPVPSHQRPDTIRYLEQCFEWEALSTAPSIEQVDATQKYFESLAARHGRYTPAARGAAMELAGELWKADKGERAELLIREQHSWLVENHGPDHPKLASVLRDLSEFAMARDDTERARKLLVQAERLGANDPDSGFRVKLRVAQAQIALIDDDSERAASCYEEAYEAQVKLNGPASNRSQGLREALATTLVVVGEFERAAREFEGLLATKQGSGAGDALRPARVSLKLGLVCGRLGRHEKARAHLTRAHALASELEVPGAAKTEADAADILARFFACKGDEEQTREWRRLRKEATQRLAAETGSERH